MKKWAKETASSSARKWEELYRNRFQHDKRVRSTHGVNCTGSCSWEVFVKDGIVTWEMQATDYPSLEKGLPPYEPRGCPRGISTSWYLYSPLRVKYPYVRGTLLSLWREARKTHADPVAAWAAIVNDPEKRRSYQRARGKGGFRRVSWDEAVEIIAAAVVHTIKTRGPDRLMGFTPIPAMSMVSYASGARFLSLLGGTIMSFYDWYADLPPASPEIFGEQTDVPESADWYNSRFVAVMGANLNMTRTPDTHFITEMRHAGGRLVVISPDFSEVASLSDWWIPIQVGKDGAFWMAVNHVILKEYYADRQVPFFEDYLKRFTDMPFLVRLDGSRPGKYLRASLLKDYKNEENGEWKLLIWDKNSGRPRMPNGTLGFRWSQKPEGKWNLRLEDGKTGDPIDPELTFIHKHDAVQAIEVEDFSTGKVFRREVPVRHVKTAEGTVAVTTVFDLIMAQFGISRGLKGDYPESYDDDSIPFTPAWQEKETGIQRETVIRFAREWATNGEKTQGKNMIICGGGTNQWYHTNLLYRAGIVALMLTGSVGTNGGGLAHYVGQEKVAPIASWAALAFALDWGKAPRHQNAPSYHYVHSDQWRYDKGFRYYDTLRGEIKGHTIDQQILAVKRGWLPFFPQFNRNPLELVKEARENGAEDDAAVVRYVVEQLKSDKLKFAVEDPDAEENWPRVWFIWRANAIGSSAKGHEFFLKHYLGTHSNAITEEVAKDEVSEVVWRDKAPEGKMDLVVDLNFRMDTSALYSDIVLPAATWYEKDDLNSTDMHTFIHPLQQAVPPAWESKDDWNIFKAIARRFSELAKEHLPGEYEDIVMLPLQHDTPDEIAQPEIKDWTRGEVEAIPGKTMPKFRIVKRNYAAAYDQMTTLGEAVAKNGVAAHGLKIPVEDFYEELRQKHPYRANGKTYPSLQTAREAADAILLLDPVCNGELAYRAFAAEEKKTGLKLADLAEKVRGIRYTFEDIVARPQRLHTSPTWSGITNDGRAYNPYTLNRERLIPWRTLTGRQHFYLDHENYFLWGENLPTYKPPLAPDHLNNLEQSRNLAQGRVMRYITPHGKWGIHTTFTDNLRMLTLSRGGYPVWINDKDAEELGIRDNDWVELYNDNGVFVQRCITSARIPRGTVFIYHATERTVGIPVSPMKNRRAGMHNSLTRVLLKPLLMSGGYAQFTYFLNYWGPPGINRDSFVFIRKIEEPKF